MAKVLLINGSPREHGNTFTALSEVAKTLNDEDVETEIISIGKQAVHGCIACGMHGREGKCTFRDDPYYKVWRAVKDGIDGLVIGSSVMASRMARSAPCSIVCSTHWEENWSSSQVTVWWCAVGEGRRLPLTA